MERNADNDKTHESTTCVATNHTVSKIHISVPLEIRIESCYYDIVRSSARAKLGWRGIGFANAIFALEKEVQAAKTRALSVQQLRQG